MKITKRDINNFLFFWEYSDYNEVESYLKTVDDFYSSRQCVAIINHIDKLQNLEINGIKVHVYGTLTKTFLNHLNNKYGSNTIILELINYCYLEDGLDFNDFGFFKQEFMVDECEYILHNTIYYMNKPKNFLNNLYLKSIYWKEISNLSNIEIKKMSKDEILKYVYNPKNGTTTYLQDFSGSSFVGFHYFGSMIFEQHRLDQYYIVALYQDNIIGLISIKTYDKSRKQDKSILLKFISYIDVRNDCKYMGIANKMIAYLNEVEDDFIVGTDMSEEGKKANIHSVFSKHLKDKWVSSYEQYYKDYTLKKDLR